MSNDNKAGNNQNQQGATPPAAGQSGNKQGGNERTGNETVARERPAIATFTVEAGDHKNSGHISVDTLKLRPRGRWAKESFNSETGDAVATDMGMMMQRMPNIPGIRFEVNVRESTVRQFDPLESNPKLRDAIEAAMDAGETTIKPVDGGKVRAWPEVVTKLDRDELKTLLLEIARKTHVGENRDARMFFPVPGSEPPTLDDLKGFPGRELYDLWNSNPHKPRYVEDAQEYNERLARSGGQTY